MLTRTSRVEKLRGLDEDGHLFEADVCSPGSIVIDKKLESMLVFGTIPPARKALLSRCKVRLLRRRHIDQRSKHLGDVLRPSTSGEAVAALNFKRKVHDVERARIGTLGGYS